MFALLGAAESVCSMLLGLVSNRVIPITLGLELFTLKVDAVIAAARWQWVGIPGDKVTLDDKYCSWARTFLGGRSWNNWAVAASEWDGLARASVVWYSQLRSHALASTAQ